MNKDIIVSQIAELEGLIDNAPTTTAFKLEMKSRLDKIKENLLTESLKDDLQKFVNKGVDNDIDPDNNSINHPLHYQSCNKEIDIDAITCMRAAFGDEKVKAFCLCNAMKYIFRSQLKGQNTDINKTIWYLNKFLELKGYE